MDETAYEVYTDWCPDDEKSTVATATGYAAAEAVAAAMLGAHPGCEVNIQDAATGCVVSTAYGQAIIGTERPFRCERCGADIVGGVNAWGDDDIYCVECMPFTEAPHADTPGGY